MTRSVRRLGWKRGRLATWLRRLVGPSLRADRSAESWSGKPFVTQALRSVRKVNFHPTANEVVVHTPHSILRMSQGTLGTVGDHRAGAAGLGKKNV